MDEKDFKRLTQEIVNMRDRPVEEFVALALPDGITKEGLSKAAEEFANNYQGDYMEAPFDGFIAGVKWMAAQGETINGIIFHPDPRYVAELIAAYTGTMENGQKVICQVRKKVI